MSVSSISSVAAPPPIQTQDASAPNTPTLTPDDSSAAPPALAPLPPGQGTRIDQIA